jgi:hypothetical protein
LALLDPDPYWKCESGPRSPKLTNKPDFHPFKKAFVPDPQWFGSALKPMEIQNTDSVNTIFSVADPDPESGAFLTPGSGIGQKSGSGSGMITQIIFPRALKQFFGLKY